MREHSCRPTVKDTFSQRSTPGLESRLTVYMPYFLLSFFFFKNPFNISSSLRSNPATSSQYMFLLVFRGEKKQCRGQNNVLDIFVCSPWVYLKEAVTHIELSRYFFFSCQHGCLHLMVVDKPCSGKREWSSLRGIPIF